MTTSPVQKKEDRNSLGIALNRAVYSIRQSWFFWGVGLLLLWVGLPWLAPVLMQLGWEAPAKAIYFIYSFQCHQLPQRSFFLFGQKSMYSISEIQAVWPQGTDPMGLRQFIGTPEVGYKVAWSDRMVSAYSSIPLAALLWWPLRRRLKPLPLIGFFLLMLPMAIDGVTHMISDLAGLGQGFRYTNAWLAELTNHALPANFYAGNALGSLNSWLRLITGTLFGIGIVWFAFPYIEASFRGQGRQIETKFEEAGVSLK
ncbi:MAG: DUF2085 domain-containing protein [Anaerolineales bacterium]